jgi:hypothetical protein
MMNAIVSTLTIVSLALICQVAPAQDRPEINQSGQSSAHSPLGSHDLEPFSSESAEELMQLVIRNLTRNGNQVVFGPFSGMVRKLVDEGDHQFLEFHGEGVEADRLVYVRFDNHETIHSIEATVDYDAAGHLVVSRINDIIYSD